MLRLAVLAASALALSLAAAIPGPAAGAPGAPHVQRVSITFLAGDRVLEGNVALAAGVPVQMTVINYTRQFHTFTVPGLKLSQMILPARGNGPRRTTFTFTPKAWGTFAWHCVICPSGVHGKRHSMDGSLYAIVSPTALP